MLFLHVIPTVLVALDVEAEKEVVTALKMVS